MALPLRFACADIAFALEDARMDTRPLNARTPNALITRFEAAFETRPDFAVRAPGRVDLIGTHTDYNDGWVLPAAVNRYTWAMVKELPAPIVTLRALDLGEQEAAFRLTDLESKTTLTGQPLPDWALYAAGVAWSLQEAGLATPGSQMTISSEIPVGAGLSSSAAVEVAYALAWEHITGWEVDRMALAQMCQRAENAYVGVSSGLMDQFSSLFGRADHALLFDCRTHEWSSASLSEEVALVVADTGTRRSLATSRYNERRAECEAAVRALQAHLPDITALRDVSIDDFNAYGETIPQPARKRAEHIINENARVLIAAQALKRGSPDILGQMMDESYISSRDLFEASGPELEAMWQASQGHEARLGGRFLGAGWAGCMIFLAQADGADAFMRHLSRRYAGATGQQPVVYKLQAADGAQVVELEDI
jgi:galactokinase